jgi:hypothetical protein
MTAIRLRTSVTTDVHVGTRIAVASGQRAGDLRYPDALPPLYIRPITTHPRKPVLGISPGM